MRTLLAETLSKKLVEGQLSVRQMMGRVSETVFLTATPIGSEGGAHSKGNYYLANTETIK